MNKDSLITVHDNDLEKLLEKLGVLQDVRDGKKKCKFTGTIITLENLHSIFPESGDIKFVSDDPEAIKQLSVYLNQKRK